MSSPIFRGFLLLGLLCLWVTQTEQALSLTIDQAPTPAEDNKDLTLTVKGVAPGDIQVISWYSSEKVDQTKLIYGKVTSATVELTKTSKVGGTRGTDASILVMKPFKKSDGNLCTVQVITNTDVGTATIAFFSSANFSAMSSSILLLAAVLFSSLRLL